MRKIWQWLRIPALRWGLFIGVGGTSVFLFAFTHVVAYTNTMEFCVSCHSMSFPYEEYKKSFHFRNAIGIQAGCSDCHVPREYPEKLVAKIMAVKDLYGELMGHAQTPEAFEEMRLAMAQRVWAKMEASESRECRVCHDFATMIMDEQGRRARRKHTEAFNEGGHCIQCHKGVAHELPHGYDD